jgi:hypothetical protein
MNGLITLEVRAGFYNARFPKWPPLRADDRWLDGMWILGNDYKAKVPYYGAYPPNYLKRVGALFPDARKVLHLFSGSLPKSVEYTRFDMRHADVTGDAHHLASYFPKKRFDLIYVDPPYSAEDCEHYGCSMVKRNVILAECVKVLERGGFIVWLDQVLPMFKKKELQMCGVIGLVRSTNHRFRVCTLFQKL